MDVLLINKQKLFLLPVALLLGLTLVFSCDPADDDDAKPSGPSITGATYDKVSALLALEGSNLGNAKAADIAKIMVDEIALSGYVADTEAKGAASTGLTAGKYRIKNDGKMIWIVLTSGNKGSLNTKSGMNMDGKKPVSLLVLGRV